MQQQQQQQQQQQPTTATTKQDVYPRSVGKNEKLISVKKDGYWHIVRELLLLQFT
jgi:hypothetical protein